MIDEIDRKTLIALQENARTPNVEIARRVKMVPSGVFARIRKLEEHGIIRAYEARLDAKVLGFGLVAFVFVRSDERAGAVHTAKLLARIPEVQEVHHIAGEDCFLVKVRVENTEALGQLLRKRFGAIKSVTGTRTTIVLETIKETAKLPVRQNLPKRREERSRA